MWTEQLPNGKYKAVERYTDPITGKSKKISVVIDRDTRTARKEAQRILDQKIEALFAKTTYDNMTFRELIDKYTDTISNPTSKRSIASVLKRVAGKLSPDARIRALTAPYVQDQLWSEPPQTYNRSLKIFKAAMRWGYGREYLSDVSWLSKLKPKPDNVHERIEDKYLEPEELQKLIGYTGLLKWQLLTRFLAMSGLRIGEALALNVEDIDTYIHVTKTMDPATGKVMDSPKTADSVRDVFIQPELAEVVSDIRRWRLTEMMQTGTRGNAFFIGCRYAHYKKAMACASKAAGIEKACTPHILRHTHASLLAAAGVPLETISRRLGHADSAITKEVYLHITEKLRQKEESQLSTVKIL